MKKQLFAGVACALSLALAVAPAAALAQNVPNYTDQGGAKTHIGNGGLLQVENGGVANIASGGKFEIGGYDYTGALTNAVSGIAANYRMARGTVALSGANPTTVTTGLTGIVECQVTLNLTSAPTGTTVLTYSASGGTLSIYEWKATSSSVTTLIASTGTETVGWECDG